MKKLTKITALAVSLFSLCFGGFIGCSDISSDETATVSGVNDVKNQKTVTLTARADEGTLSFGTNGDASRTILPDGLNGDSVDFWLAYKTLKETTWTVKSTTFTASADDKTVGTITEEFDLNSYEFKLYAVPKNAVTAAADLAESTVKAAAVLAGYATADLRYQNSVAFTLTANNMTGQGAVNIAIKTVPSFKIPDGYTVTAGLYKLKDGSLVYPSGTPAPITVTAGVVNDTTSLKVDTMNIDAGDYNVVVKLTNTNVTPNKTYTCSEKVIVLVNQTSKGTVWIRDIIEYKPTQPADFIAGFTDSNSVDNPYYTVEFAWTDTSDCETGFELELFKVDDKTPGTPKYPLMPTDDDEWGDTAKTKGLAKDFNAAINTTSPSQWENIADADVLLLNQSNISTCPLYVSYSDTDNVGSLNMNQSHLSMVLPMEHRFVARIRAVNDVGKSDYTYLDIHSATGKTAGCTKDDSITVGANTFDATQTTAQYTLTTGLFDADVATINRYKIKYNLNGGTYVDAAGTLTATAMPALTLYESQHNTDAATATVSSDKVAIIHPNSIKADASVTPPIAADLKAKNTYLDTTGTQQTDVQIELKNKQGYYWRQWRQDDINGTPYVTTPDTVDGTGKVTTPGDYTPPLYTGYTNLQLVATYTTTKTIDGDVNFQDMTRYELNKGFITVTLKEGVTDKTSTYITDTSTLFDEATGAGDGTADTILSLADATDPIVVPDTIDSITLALNANAKYKDDAATPVEHDIKYDKMHIFVTRVSDNETIVDADAVSGSYTVSLKGYTYGKYIFTITATKGKYTYSVTQVLRITQ